MFVTRIELLPHKQHVSERKLAIICDGLEFNTFNN